MIVSDFKVTVSVSINASKRDTWQIISRPGNLEDCHPFCESNSVIRWGDANSKDTIKYYNGIIFTRLFVNWYENDGYGTFTQRSISTTGMSEITNTIIAVDLDQDNDIDIVAYARGGTGTLSWFENDGEENFTQHIKRCMYADLS